MPYGFVEPGTKTLGGVRTFLGKMEKGILIGLNMRSDYSANAGYYRPGSSKVADFQGSEFDRLFRGLLFAQTKSFEIADEVPFYADQPQPRKKPIESSYPLGPSSINLCPELMKAYFSKVSEFCGPGDDGKYIYAAAADASLLDLASTRIHRGGVWVADMKFGQDAHGYRKLVERGDEGGITAKITDPVQEAIVLARVSDKAAVNGVDPAFARDFFKDPLMRLTKKVQVARMFEIVRMQGKGKR